MNERIKRDLNKKGVDVEKVEATAEKIMTSIVDTFSPAEIELLIERLTCAYGNLKYCKPGEPYRWGTDG